MYSYYVLSLYRRCINRDLENNNMTRLNKKQKSSVRRQVDHDLGVTPPNSSIHKNKKKYNRKLKHKNQKDEV